MPRHADKTSMFQTAHMAQGICSAETAALRDKRAGNRLVFEKHLDHVFQTGALRGHELHGPLPPGHGVLDVAPEVQCRLTDIMHEGFQPSMHCPVHDGIGGERQERQPVTKAT